jgi:hypothetical protein
MNGSGILSDSDLAFATHQCELDPAANPFFDRICDLSGVTGVSISDASLDAWVMNPLSNPPVRHAIVCNAAPVVKRVLDYVNLSRKQFHPVSVFPTCDGAMKWLNQNQPAISDL